MVTQNDSSIDSQEKYTNLNIYHNQANRKRKKKKKGRRHKETNQIFKNDGFDYGKPSLMGSSNSRLSSILSQNKNQTQSTLSDDIYQQTHAQTPNN